MSQICPKCASTNSEESLFCIACGFRFSSAVTAHTSLALKTRTLITGSLAVLLVGLFAGLSFFMISKISNNTSDQSFNDGKKAGVAEGQRIGFEEGKVAGYAEGVLAGKAEGIASVGDLDAIKKSSYQNGYAAGSNDAFGACKERLINYINNQSISGYDEIVKICK